VSRTSIEANEPPFMTDIASRTDGLSPEKRALLAHVDRQTPARCNTLSLLCVPRTPFTGVPRS
jgi:hypothetical protein